MSFVRRRAAAPFAGAAAVLTLALSAAPAARAAEGALAVRAGDTVRGTLARCLDRQVSEIQLLEGQVFRLRLRPTRSGSDSIFLRVHDPSGLAAEGTARVRQSGSDILAGPFRVTRSGTWNFEVSTPTAHGSAYEMETAVRRTRATTARIGGRRRTAKVPVLAGSTLRVLGPRLPTLALARPGETGGDVLDANSPTLAALRGPGLAAAGAGTYTFTALERGGRALIRITPPRRTAAGTVVFPALLDDSHSVATWQGVAGWVLDRARTAPDEEGYTPEPGPLPPATSPFSGSIVEDCPAPGEATADLTFDDAEVFVGPRSGVGLPAAGIPRLDDVVRLGRLELAGTTPSYVLTRASDSLGDVVTRVRFVTDGVPSQAPLALDGRVRMDWTDDGGAQALRGSWSVTFDPVRGVQVLDGAELRTPDGARQIATAAAGFAVLSSDGAWPQGSLAFSVTDTRLGVDFVRTESFDGDAAVRVDVRFGDGSTDSAIHEFR